MSLHLLPYIAIGGALGAMSRYAVSVSSVRLLGHGYPYGTLLVNVIGSFVMGALIGLIARYLPEGKTEIHSLLAVGFLGSFTTFSTFSLDAMLMLERHQYGVAMLYITLSVVASIAALSLGLWLTRLSTFG